MSGEVYSELEPTFAPDEIIHDTEYEPSSISCENKLGFTALCASCPLVALLGGCPKEIREEASNSSLGNNNEIAISFFDTNIVESFDFLLNPIKENNSEAQGISFQNEPLDTTPALIEPRTTNQKPPTVNLVDDVLNEQAPVRHTAPEKIETPNPHRSFYDLLFDETIAVVLAPQFMRSQKQIIKTVPKPLVKVINTTIDPAKVVSTTIELETSPIFDYDVTIVEQAPRDALIVSEQPIIQQDEVATSNLEENNVKEYIDEPVIVTIIEKKKVRNPTVLDIPLEIKETLKIRRPTIGIEQPVISKIINPLPTLYTVASKEDFPQKPVLILIEKKDGALEVIDSEPLDTDDVQFTFSTSTLQESDSVYELPAMPETAIIVDTGMSLTPIPEPISTPEILVGLKKTSSTTQPWSLNVLLGSLALFKLVSISFTGELLAHN